MPPSIESFTESLCRLPVVGVVVRAFLKSRSDHAKDMAASIAYFSFFSLFPFLLGVIAVASLFLDSAEVQSRLSMFLAEALPGSAAFVSENIDSVIRLRGAAGIASIVGLLWSASKMSSAVSRGINHALGLTRSHPAFLSPLRHFSLTLMVSLLLLSSLGLSTVVSFLSQLDLGLLGNAGDAVLLFAGGHATSYLLLLVTSGFLYKLVPYERPSWAEVLPGALLAALLIEVAKTLFVYYINGVARLEAVYGSVSSVIVLLLWLYLTARIVLLGAELIAVCREKAVPANGDE